MNDERARRVLRGIKDQNRYVRFNGRNELSLLENLGEEEIKEMATENEKAIAYAMYKLGWLADDVAELYGFGSVCED